MCSNSEQEIITNKKANFVGLRALQNAYVRRQHSSWKGSVFMQRQAARLKKNDSHEFSTLDANRALDLVVALMKIPGPSCHEAKIAQYVRRRLTAAGIPASAISTDNAHKKSPAGGSTGNLIVKLPGTLRAPRRMLMAHLDTVPLCVGCRPIQRGDSYISGNPRSALGADNRSGVAAVLNAILEIKRKKIPHPPLTLLFTVQEELGLFGSRFVNVGKLGKPKLAWNWDGRGPHRITHAAIGGRTLSITFHGIASHAGGAADRGVSAIALAGLAIQDLVSGGWHGEFLRGGKVGTCNLATIHGGDATNVVTDRIDIEGECRSFDRRLLDRIAREVERACERAVRSLKNSQGQRGSVTFHTDIEYEPFSISKNAPSVKAAEVAIRELGMKPELLTTQGALDSNWLNARGIPVATLGAGQVAGHSLTERLDIEQFLTGCKVALQLATSPKLYA
ncbi:M20/M25/M40 family metallo-hydrolase [Pirellulales bacterium]|jgi:tripeptide aminopeptidase|nr:M20/M25/M40 family metallo-hydrolase [Pirellulales bacterium]